MSLGKISIIKKQTISHKLLQPNFGKLGDESAFLGLHLENATWTKQKKQHNVLLALQATRHVGHTGVLAQRDSPDTSRESRQSYTPVELPRIKLNSRREMELERFSGRHEGGAILRFSWCRYYFRLETCLL